MYLSVRSYLYAGGGGAGNPGANSYRHPANSDRSYREVSGKGENGTGGLLIILADEFLNNGKITSNGSKGGDASGNNSGASESRYARRWWLRSWKYKYFL